MLQDGTVLKGTAIGSAGTALGEVVFNTSMTGYQEMLSDPSYGGQILTFTYPLIGNYGVSERDFESDRVQVEGVVMRELCDAPNHWRSGGTLADFLLRHKVVGIAGIDTRSLTRHLRDVGVLAGGITSELTERELRERLEQAPRYDSLDFVKQVSTDAPYHFVADPEGPEASPQALPPSPARGKRIAVLDLGVKRNILRRLCGLGCELTVYPAGASADQLLSEDPDGVLVSPGPGDPKLLGYVVEATKGVVGKKPLLGICLGHQALAHAFGGDTFKLKFGHRGGNHPVKDLATDQVTITSQNHGFAVDAQSLEGTGLEVARVNLNDGTVEGMRHRELPIWSIQYHPEASPGPWDSDSLFCEFLKGL
jgi:carbamoyl-phosphate synthase small subunit